MKLKIFLIGLLAGAISWAICPILFEKPEPYDTSMGLYLGQFILIITAFYISHKHAFSAFLISITAMYIGINTYVYVFGSSEQKAWWILNLMTSISLILLPLCVGIMSYIVKRIQHSLRDKKS